MKKETVALIALNRPGSVSIEMPGRPLLAGLIEATSNAVVEFCAATMRTHRRSNAAVIAILPLSSTVFIFKFRTLRTTECLITAPIARSTYRGIRGGVRQLGF